MSVCALLSAPSSDNLLVDDVRDDCHHVSGWWVGYYYRSYHRSRSVTFILELMRFAPELRFIIWSILLIVIPHHRAKRARRDVLPDQEKGVMEDILVAEKVTKKFVDSTAVKTSASQFPKRTRLA